MCSMPRPRAIHLISMLLVLASLVHSSFSAEERKTLAMHPDVDKTESKSESNLEKPLKEHVQSSVYSFSTADIFRNAIKRYKEIKGFPKAEIMASYRSI